MKKRWYLFIALIAAFEISQIFIGLFMGISFALYLTNHI